jgi:hypothetical protein
MLLSYFPQVHFPPVLAPQLACPQLLPAVHLPVQPAAPQLPVDVFVVSTAFADKALTIAIPPTSKSPMTMLAIIQVFIFPPLAI